MFQNSTAHLLITPFVCPCGHVCIRRREYVDGKKVLTKDGVRDNRWVVPYNERLLRKFNCHVNVEICTSIKAVKYLYKYTYKGPDRACMEMKIDEISEFMDARYVTAPEAYWRIFEFPMHAKSHAVERLPLHVRNSQQKFSEVGKEHEALTNLKRTKLDAWLELNKKEHAAAHVRRHNDDNKYPDAADSSGERVLICGYDHASQTYEWPCKNLRYVDLPDRYTWQAKESLMHANSQCSCRLLF